MFEPGRLIAGKYRVERVLGEGGMGVVVLARHQQLDQQVALKFMHTGAALPPEALGRFMREARAVAKLKSEHVARVLDVDTLADGTPYIVMEYLEGRDLSARIDESRLPHWEAVDYVLQACVGLAEAHAQGIVHRDLKPANLFLTHTADGAPLVKILDFGISKLKSEDDFAASTTRTGAVMGSPLFMPPEQARSSKDVDARADIWSLGAVLYKLMSQRPPFLADNVADLFADILHRPHSPLRAHVPDVPPGLEVVIDRCLAKQPADRFPNLSELALALAPFASSENARLATRVLRFSGDARASDPTVLGFGTGSPTVPEPRRDGAALAQSGASGSSTEAPLSVTQDKKPARALWVFGAAAVGVALTIALIVARSGPDPEPEVAGPTEPAVSSSSDVAPLSTTIVTPAADPAPSEVPADASAPPAASAPPEKTAAKLAVRSPKQTAIPKPPLAKSASPAKSAQTPPAKPPEDPFGTMQ